MTCDNKISIQRKAKLQRRDNKYFGAGSQCQSGREEAWLRCLIS